MSHNICSYIWYFSLSLEINIVQHVHVCISYRDSPDSLSLLALGIFFQKGRVLRALARLPAACTFNFLLPLHSVWEVEAIAPNFRRKSRVKIV